MSDNNQWGGNQNQQSPVNQQNPSQPYPNSGPQGNPPYGFQPGGQNPYGYRPSVSVVPSPGFVESIRLFFTQYATFSGRSRRSEFWYVVLFQFVLGFVISIFELPQMSNIVQLLLLIPNLALQCRRLHDIGRSGNWIWAQVIATVFFLIAMLYLVVFMIYTIPEVKDQYIQMGIDVSIFYNYNGLLNIPGLVIAVMVIAAIAIFIMFLVFDCTDSQKGTNQYGPSSKYPDMGTVQQNNFYRN